MVAGQTRGCLAEKIAGHGEVHPHGGADAATNSRLAAALEKARRESVARDVIERAIAKGAGTGSDKASLEHMTFEGYAPHKVPVIVEAVTDNHNRTAPELRVLFKKGQLGASGSNKFLFDHVGLVEAHTAKAGVDIEEAAIEAGANEVEALSHAQNDDIPAEATGARFITDRTNTHGVSKWLSENGWTVEVGAFLQALDDHDDVHRVWAAVK